MHSTMPIWGMLSCNMLFSASHGYSRLLAAEQWSQMLLDCSLLLLSFGLMNRIMLLAVPHWHPQALLLPAPAGGQLCYDSVTTLQVLLPPGTACRGTGQPGDPEPLLHFSHPPLQGQAPGAARST
jgi:hypothetical protein